MDNFFSSHINDQDVQSIDFFHDFIVFLTRLKEKPIKRTVTGNISLKDIELLLPQFRTMQNTFEEYRKFGWRVHSEDNLRTLSQIKLLAAVMHLTYKRKGRLFLSKNGRAFLLKLTPLAQYEQMVLHYWHEVNWDYFSPSTQVNKQTLSEILQDKQEYFWKLFFQKGTMWIDYHTFCKATEEYFQLQPFFENAYLGSDYERNSDIDFIFFRTILLLFGCIEIEETQGKYEWQREISKFRPTPVGLHMFQKALY